MRRVGCGAVVRVIELRGLQPGLEPLRQLAGAGVRGAGDLSDHHAPVRHPAHRQPAVSQRDVGRVGLQEMARDQQHLLAHGASGQNRGAAGEHQTAARVGAGPVG